MATPAMIDALGSNIFWPCPIWKLTSRDGLTAAYAAHTRFTVGRGINPTQAFVFNGVTYKPSVTNVARDVLKIGLTANSVQVDGIFDDIITRPDVEAGRWKMAKIVYEYVNYLDLSMGSTRQIKGIAGKWVIAGFGYQTELLSNSVLLEQLFGHLTSPTDRNNWPAGVPKASFTVARNVTASPDRRHLTIDGAPPPNDYYKYGVIRWLNGPLSKTSGMEIKGNVGSALELMLPMPADISATGPNNQVTLLAGYDGTREQARDKFNDVIDMDCEPDLPGLRTVLSYPE
jgi:uncharacterized phage protein (TIGR02218 family)